MRLWSTSLSMPVKVRVVGRKVFQLMISIPSESLAANLLLNYYFFRMISMVCSIQSFVSNKTMSGFIP